MAPDHENDDSIDQDRPGVEGDDTSLQPDGTAEERAAAVQAELPETQAELPAEPPVEPPGETWPEPPAEPRVEGLVEAQAEPPEAWAEAPAEPWDASAQAWPQEPGDGGEPADGLAVPDEQPGPDEGSEEPVAVLTGAPSTEAPPPAAAPARPAGPRRPPGRTAGRGTGRRRPPAPRRAAPSPDATPAPARSRRGMVIALSVLSAVVVALAVGGVLIARSGAKRAAPPRSITTAPATTLVTLPDAAFVTFKEPDPQFAFTIRYPRAWRRSDTPDAEIRLTVSDGKQYSARVRVVHTAEATTPANLANIKAFVEGTIGTSVQILKVDTVTVNGLIGFRYIYNYTASDTGLTGSQVRYFLFQGHKMNDIIFEAVPSDNFNQIEGIFDQMLDSFHSDPEPTTTSAGG